MIKTEYIEIVATDTNGTVIDIVIDKGTIEFLGNQSAVSNSQKANEVIELIAPILIDYLKTHPDKNIYLIGSVSSGSEDPKFLPMSDCDDELSNLPLSEARAITIKSMLIEKGVPADKLVTKGLGTKVPWRLDEWLGGEYDEMKAIQNQTVTIISDTSDKYNQVISDFGADVFK